MRMVYSPPGFASYRILHIGPLLGKPANKMTGLLEPSTGQPSSLSAGVNTKLKLDRRSNGREISNEWIMDDHSSPLNFGYEPQDPC